MLDEWTERFLDSSDLNEYAVFLFQNKFIF